MTPSLLDLRFLLLLGLLVGLRCLVPRERQTILGIVASVLLVGLASLQTLALIGGTALFILFPCARLMRRFKAGEDEEAGKAKARRVLIAGCLLVIAVWLLFKTHKQFRLPFLTGTSMSARLLTVFGFSYFLFKALNYLYMHYLLDLPEEGPGRVLYYALFLPTLTSGPIQKYTEFTRELDANRAIDLATFGEGVYRITKGYFFKVCLGASLQAATQQLMLVGEPNAYQSLLIIVCMYLFFFFDFAGYSHIAIGLAALLGIKVPENFRSPFLVTSITELWRNWHITLGAFFRDHVFIPLGGMRAGRLKAGLIAGVIMVACGLWHGLSWMFLVWGLWHGLMLFLEAVTGSKPMPRGQRHGPRYWGRVAWTNARAMFGILFFLPGFQQVGHVLGGFLRWW